MHVGRIFVLVGAVLAPLGLPLKALVMDDVDHLPALSEAVPGIPDGAPTIFDGLDTWAQIVVVMLLVAVVVLALLPPIKQPQDRVSAGITGLAGVAIFVYAYVKFAVALNDADAINSAVDQLGEVPEEIEVGMANAGFGFWLIIIGSALIAIGGVVGFRARKRSSEDA